MMNTEQTSENIFTYIHPYVIYSRSELVLKSYIFMENNKINSLTNLFQYLLSAVILSE